MTRTPARTRETNVLHTPRPFGHRALPPVSLEVNKQNGGDQPAQLEPVARENSNARPIRSTRNPAPYYVDSIQLSSLRPWSASKDEISAINQSIGG